MKVAGIDRLLRGDLPEGMMKAGQDPPTLILTGRYKVSNPPILSPLLVEHKGGIPWCSAYLHQLTTEDWFRLPLIMGPRLWVPAPTAMGAVSCFTEDRIARPHFPHIFIKPHLMTHLWRKQLGKDADVVLTFQSGSEFWPRDMFEPLIILIVFPIVHVENYRGPWVAKGTQQVTALESCINKGSKTWRVHRDGTSGLHELEGHVQSMWETEGEDRKSVV